MWFGELGRVLSRMRLFLELILYVVVSKGHISGMKSLLEPVNQRMRATIFVKDSYLILKIVTKMQG